MPGIIIPQPNTPYYKGILQIGGLNIPCYPGASFAVPKNWQVPQVIGNYWAYHYTSGFQSPVVELQLVVRDVTTECLSTTFLNYFLLRGQGVVGTDSNDPISDDTTPIAGGINFWNGRQGFNMTGVKADSFSLSCGKGEQIRMTARFAGTGMTVLSAAPTFTKWTSDPILNYKAVNFTGSLANIVWNWNTSYSNNHTPDMSLNNSDFPAAHNAGTRVAMLDYMLQASSAQPADLTGIGITIAGATLTRNLNFASILDGNPSDLTVSAPRSMRRHQLQILGTDPQDPTKAPLTIS